MRVILATVAKDEAARYWRSALEAWSDFSDLILYLDDRSEDATAEIAAEFPKVQNITPPRQRDSRRPLWGDEGRYREYLFRRAWSEAELGDIIFWEDADMVPAINPRRFFEQLPDVDMFAFTLYDLWDCQSGSTLMYRHEKPFWMAAQNPRVWAIRRIDVDFDVIWAREDIHVGHLPATWWHIPHPEPCFLPPEYGILHYGYINAEDRKEKAKAYMSVKDSLQPFELKHAETILAPKPQLKTLRFTPEYLLRRAK